MAARPGTLVVPALILAVLMLTPGVQAACTPVATNGVLYVPTLSPVTPEHYVHAVQGGAFYKVDVSPNQVGFELTPSGGTSPSTICALSGCAVFPDFNVGWYTEGSLFDTRIGIHNSQGPDEGGIPSGADYALIHMVHGPDTGTGDSSLGAAFNFNLTC